MNTDILGISELKWTEIGEFNSDYHYIFNLSGDIWLVLCPGSVVNDGVPVSFSLAVFSGYRPRCGYVRPRAEPF